MEELAALGTVTQRSSIFSTSPMGPAQRRFANAAATIDSEYDPPALLAALKWMEREFGRRTFQRWGDRVLDLDIVLWDGGEWTSRELCIPHTEYRQRAFVLAPAAQIAADWRDPVTGLSVRHLHARLTRRKPATRGASAPLDG